MVINICDSQARKIAQGDVLHHWNDSQDLLSRLPPQGVHVWPASVMFSTPTTTMSLEPLLTNTTNPGVSRSEPKSTMCRQIPSGPFIFYGWASMDWSSHDRLVWGVWREHFAVRIHYPVEGDLQQCRFQWSAAMLGRLLHIKPQISPMTYVLHVFMSCGPCKYPAVYLCVL